MTDPKASATSQSIVVEYDLRHPPERVWRAITEAGLIARWLMNNDFSPVVGHRFTFKAQPMPGWDGIVHCEVREVIPNERLVYTWCGGSDDLTTYGSRLDTVVTWTLSPTSSGGTLLRLEHAGFLPKNAFAFETMGKGWRGKLAETMDRILRELG
jgi:uncharacterized protein YndB with AHSA1/START domain